MLPGPGRGLPAPVARGPVPVGRAGLGPASACARPMPTASPGGGRPRRRGPRRSPSPCATTSPGSCRRPRGAVARPSPSTGRPATCSTPCGPAGRCSTPSCAPSPGACRSRWRRACGTSWPGASSPPTGSRPCARCSRPATPGTGAGATSSAAGSAARGAPVRHPGAQGGEGRWALLPTAVADDEDPDTLAEQVAGQLLARWGVVFWDLMAREDLALPWREVVWALRRLEARGVVRGGRFVTGFAGEQYALPEAVEELRRVRRSRARRRDRPAQRGRPAQPGGHRPARARGSRRSAPTRSPTATARCLGRVAGRPRRARHSAARAGSHLPDRPDLDRPMACPGDLGGHLERLVGRGNRPSSHRSALWSRRRGRRP